MELLYPDAYGAAEINTLLDKCVVEHEEQCLSHAALLLQEVQTLIHKLENEEKKVTHNGASAVGVFPAASTYGVEERQRSLRELFEHASQIAGSEDQVQWRRLSKRVKTLTRERLQQWYSANSPVTSLTFPSPDRVLELAEVFSPNIVFALAGVESAKEPFRDQAHTLEDLLNVKDWPREGVTSVVYAPRSIAFIFQALYGALCMETSQASLAEKLVTGNTRSIAGEERRRLFDIRGIMAAPEAIGIHSRDAWKLLTRLNDEWSWIPSVFGDDDSYGVSLSAYYMFLNFLEFVDTLRARRETLKNSSREVMLSIPLYLALEPIARREQSYRLLLRNSRVISELLQPLSLRLDVKLYWSEWMRICKGHLTFFTPSPSLPHELLLEELS